MTPVIERNGVFEQARRCLPHGEGIQIVDRVLRCESSEIVCVTKTPCPDCFCERESIGAEFVSGMSFVEFVAQAAALGRIMELMVPGNSAAAVAQPRQGVVLRLRGFEIPEQPISSTTPLCISASWSQAVGGAFQVEGSVSLFDEEEHCGQLLSSGRLTIMEL